MADPRRPSLSRAWESHDFCPKCSVCHNCSLPKKEAVVLFWAERLPSCLTVQRLVQENLPKPVKALDVGRGKSAQDITWLPPRD